MGEAGVEKREGVSGRGEAGRVKREWRSGRG